MKGSKLQRRNNKNVYSHVGSVQPGRSVFDLSYEKKFTAEMGKLYPIMCDMVVPGDYFKIGNQTIIRMLPLNAPVLHDIYVSGHYFFVPLRQLGNADTREALEDTFDWVEFITGGKEGDDAQVPPTWTPTNYAKYSLWDYLGFPVGQLPTGMPPLDFPRRAYAKIWNEYFRDENLQDEVDLDNEEILLRNWTKDYFTSSLPWQQRGTGPAMPISGESSAIWNIDDIDPAYGTLTNGPRLNNSASDDTFYTQSSVMAGNLKGALDNNVVDLSTATTFSIAEFREAFGVQRWLERNARCGVRYVESLHAHWGIAPKDELLQRAAYIGGWKTPLIVSEVLQTSSTDATTPQGNMVGHGIGINDSYCGKYLCKEYGIIVGLMSIMPSPAYSQGINRQWLYNTRYEFPWPEFTHMSEQPVLNGELCVVGGDGEHNTDIFGYQGRYNEMRVKNSMVCADMRDTFNYWHLSREFSVAAPPELNSDFIECNPSRRIFADEADPGFIVSCGNLIKAVRPIPISPEPGLIDHI